MRLYGSGSTYRQPLCVINLVCTEQCLKGVISRQYEAGEVDKEFSSNVEEDEEEVEANKAEEDVNLGNIGLLLEVVEHGILAKLQAPRVSSIPIADTIPDV